MEPFAPIDTLMPLAMSAGQGANDYLGTIALGFIELVFWIAIFYAALRFTLGADSLEGASVQLAAWFIRIFLIGTIAAFLLPTIIPALIEGAFEIGTGVSRGKMTAADFLLPSRLFKTGWMEVEVLMKHSLSRCTGVVSCATNAPLLVYYLIASIILMTSFIIMIIAIILSYVYFIMEGVGVMLTIAGKGSERTDWIGRGGTATLITRFVQMVIMSAGLSIGLIMFEAVRLAGEPSLAQAVLTAVVALIIAVLVLKSEQIGSSVVGGMPGPGGVGTGAAMSMGAASLLAAGSMGALQMARGMTSGGSAPNNPGGSNPPPPPPVRGGGPNGGTSGPGGAGHGANPFDPGATNSAASQAGAPTPSSRPGTEAQAAAAAISAHARTLPPGTGAGAEAPTPQQWGDAKIMGTDIVGMTSSQASAALDAHQNYFMSRGTGGDAAPPSSHASKPSGSQGVGAPLDWMPQSQGSSPFGQGQSSAGNTSPPRQTSSAQASPATSSASNVRSDQMTSTPTSSGTPSSSGNGTSSSTSSPLGQDISGMSRTAAGAAIRERALALPKGEGEGAKPVSLVQRKDASALGTNVDGMSRSQAAAAISAHKGWYNQGVANAKWQPQSNAHPYASDNRPTPAHMRPKDSAAGGSATPESAATTEKYHNLSNGASPDPNRNAPYTTDWKERNPQEAQEVTHRLGQLKAGTWTQPQNAQEAAVRDARLKSNK